MDQHNNIYSLYISMLRPWWFPEYTPKEQKIFDILHKTIEQNFAQYWYQHIRTPAVESVDTLKKWWDEVSKQIFWLVWLEPFSKFVKDMVLRQSDFSTKLTKGILNTEEQIKHQNSMLEEIENFIENNALKDYALHFDLTVPFARYVLDHQNELAFPFKRYQVQPVRRGERSQKGRYKEFRQADIDVIWKSKEDKGYNAIYDADCVMTLATTIRKSLDMLWLQDKDIVVRYNNKAFMLAVCGRLGIENTTELLALLDKYYKLPKTDFDTKLAALLSPQQLASFVKVRNIENNTKDFPERAQYIVPFDSWLQGIQIVYDPTIVRWLDYYTGTVFETFIDDRKDLGSICSWWAYANLTEFLDSKQSFSWVGWSIWLSRLMSVLIEEYGIANTFIPQDESYLIINDWETSKAQDVVVQLRKNHKIVELYPLPDKIDKQFKYAEKKWIQYVVQVFADGTKYKKLWGNWDNLDI